MPKMADLAVYLLSPNMPKVQALYLKNGEHELTNAGNCLHSWDYTQQ